MRATLGLDDKSKRDLARGSLDVMVLSVLADGRHYGYAIQKRVLEASGQAVKAGTLYPLLHNLESQGLVSATWETGTGPKGGRDRKWYTLTRTGRDRLKTAAADWQASIARMQGLILPAVRHIATTRSEN